MKILPILVMSSLLTQGVMAAEEVTSQESEQAKQEFIMVGNDMNNISRTGASYALETIKESGKLAPFALVMNNDGSLGKLEALAPFVKKAPIGDKINYLRGQVKNLAENNKIKAGAIFSRGLGRTQMKTEEVAGLIIEQEHIKGASTVQFVPYENKDGNIVALEASSKLKPKLFFNDKIDSNETYKKIKQAVAQAEK